MTSPVAEKLFSLLNKSDFRRCQPFAGDTALAQAIMEQAVEKQVPIPLMMYWGMADRLFPEKPERLAVEYLADNLSRVSNHYGPGIRLSVVFVDTHVAFNGIRTTEDYFLAIGQMFDTVFSAKKNLQVNLSSASTHVNFHKAPNVVTFREFDALPYLVAQSNISAALKEMLQHRSNMYCHRLENTESAGIMYYELCKMEQRPMGQAFKGHIFLTYNHSEVEGKKHFGVPEGMPAVCVYSIARGITDKPWNISIEKLAYLLEKRHKPTAGFSASGQTFCPVELCA